MIQQTIFRCVRLGLECSEKSLLSTENLNGRGRILGEVDQGTGMGYQLGTNTLTNKAGEVGSDCLHLILKISLNLLAEFVELECFLA